MIFHRMLHHGWFSLLAAAPLLAGCASGPSYPKQEWPGYPKYDVDPQVIYRIDDHRYLTIENYPGCDYVKDYANSWGIPRVTYHDDKLGIVYRWKYGSALAYYRGKLIIDAPKGNTIAFPSAPIGVCTLYDKGCQDPGITYSTDAGRTWQWMPIDGRWGGGRSNSPDQFQSYTVTVTDKAIYVDMGFLHAERKPIGPGISYAPGPGNISASEVVAGLPSIKGRTPSGMDRLVCDPSIKPRGVTYHKVSPIEYFELP